MLSIDSIERGVVIDHIQAGMGMVIYNYLNLGALDCTVALIKNVKSQKRKRKDLIKIEDNIDLDLNVLGYLDPNITVNVIENDVITNKLQMSLPEKLTNVIKCKNPRCITTTEHAIAHQFKLVDREHKIYRCVYCEQEFKQ